MTNSKFQMPSLKSSSRDAVLKTLANAKQEQLEEILLSTSSFYDRETRIIALDILKHHLFEMQV